eukprot:2870311-Amphidinium_carterae.2
MNAKYVQLAVNWLQTKPLATVMLIRLVMTPIMSVLSDYLKRSGADWRVQEIVTLIVGHCQDETSPIFSFFHVLCWISIRAIVLPSQSGPRSRKIGCVCQGIAFHSKCGAWLSE